MADEIEQWDYAPEPPADWEYSEGEMHPNGKGGDRSMLLWGAGIGVGILAGLMFRRRRGADLRGQVALITGGSRGLGVLLAHEFAREGCRVVICARDEAELREASRELQEEGAEVFAVPCDVSDRSQVTRMMEETRKHFGDVDILVNNAGIIQVGPVQSMTQKDFENAMNVMFWGVLHPTFQVLPGMIEKGGGRIVNITSVGGKVSMPHMLPYNCAKFAAVAFSEGLRAEVAGQGVQVLTIVPGLMRTGSYLNALFKGRPEEEANWFSVGASMPGLSMNAGRAARQIVEAAKRGDTEKILSAPANLLARFHGAFPELTVELLGLANRLLMPRAGEDARASATGSEVHRSRLVQVLTVLGRLAASRLQTQSRAA